MKSNNPYTISFGRIPSKYLSRTSIIDSITEALERDTPDEQAFKLTGIRGTGKTVTLTAIEQRFTGREDWIVTDLRPDSDMIVGLVSHLYSSVGFITKLIDTSLNLSAFGIGVNISTKSPVTSIDYVLEIILKEIEKRNVKLLIVIDEAHKTKGMIDLIQEFQIMLRKNLPVYVIVAGLYEDIESLENADGLTFFLRAAKYEMTPLNITYIRDDYKNTLGLPFEEAEKMAFLTKGYAYAYQVLGKYMWDSGSKTLTEEVLRQLDDVLADKVYRKIWTELAPKDRWFLQFIVRKDTMSVEELLSTAKATHSQWSVPRTRLHEKGIIDVQSRGMISLRLPRFREFVEMQTIMDNVPGD